METYFIIIIIPHCLWFKLKKPFIDEWIWTIFFILEL